MPLILPSNSISAGGCEVDNSLRFDDGSSDSLQRTPSSSGNRRTWTFSTWFKRGNIGSSQWILDAYGGSSDEFHIYISSGNAIGIYTTGGGFGSNLSISTNNLVRDISAWYHLVVRCDTTQATASDRLRIYLNGVEASYGTYNNFTLNGEGQVNEASTIHYLGRRNAGGYFDGYFAETVLVDGSSLDPTSFGEFDADSGIWKPIDVSGLTFGSKGFYLPYENSAALGQDDSGNGNDFTVNNLTSVDQTTDTPTNNYCTLNPLNFGAGTLSEGNLKWNASGGAGYLAFGTIGIDMGGSNQFYWETKIDSIASGVVIGIAPTTLRWNDTGRAGSYGYYSNGDKYNGTSASSYGVSFTTGDTIGVLAGNGSITFYKNGVSQGVAWSGLSETYLPFLAEIGNTNSMNFGSPPYTISSGNSDPAGYGNFEYSTNGGYALNTKNLAEYG